MQIIKYDQVKDKIVEIRYQKVILDSDVAELYGVETRDINKAVKNNPGKFPQGYIIELTDKEKLDVVENFHHLEKVKFSRVAPKAFTERGLYMLATILKSETATRTTIAIIDTFAQIKELTQAVYQFAKATTNEQRVSVFENGTEIVAELLGNNLMVSQEETGFEIKLPFLKVTRKVTKVKQ